MRTLPLGGLSLIFGVDRLLASCLALTNIIGNTLAVFVIAKWEGAFSREKFEAYCKRQAEGSNRGSRRRRALARGGGMNPRISPAPPAADPDDCALEERIRAARGEIMLLYKVLLNSPAGGGRVGRSSSPPSARRRPWIRPCANW